MTRDGALVVALVGNPNTGKSTIFNRLTGSSQHVGNWPGKTVSRAEGRCAIDGRAYLIVDLPGTYSMNAASPEERIARDYLVSGEPDAVVIVLDAGSVERNLYLAIQVLEMDLPAVIALNMVDAATAEGITVDVGSLSDALGVPVVPTIARRGTGLDQLTAALAGLTTFEVVP